ncbi:hypothetical protein TARUN_5913 [Trichoderma arundinaceum]|uniref:BTB domain-containing protein n=1 Tax=Trichoderma arundinaceum TaxID=490622 RepID=A0A395NJP3_TRIAR|nr:hypothetical protein TARUN_5913 [Trichoderma arundinaceum]
MDQLVHQVDPDGDTLLILRNPNAPFLSATTGVWPNALPRYRSQKMKDLEYALSNFLLDEEPSVPSEREVHFRLSSKHLKLVSEYFQRMMAHNWMETNPQDGYAYSITAEDWDETALLIVMYVIHGQTERVPKAISIEMLAKIAVLVDYYNCHEAIDSLAKSWMRGLQKSCPHKYKDYGEELLMMLFASCIFPEADTFETLTGIAIWQSRGRIHTLGLPFPDNVVGE